MWMDQLSGQDVEEALEGEIEENYDQEQTQASLDTHHLWISIPIHETT